MNHEKIRKIVLTGLFAAIIFVATAYLHVNTNNGYTHFGDAFIFMAAALLPTPYACAAAAIGAGLADVVSMPIWAPATVVIKIATALLFTAKKEKIITPRNLLMLIPSLAICIVGYSCYDAVVMCGGFKTAAFVKAFASTPAYCVQVIGSSVVFVVLSLALDKINIKRRFSLVESA